MTETTPLPDAVERGYTHDKAGYTKRLNRIEGQVRGIQRMIAEDAYCIDVLTQVSATTKALQAVAMGLIDEHVRHCVRDAVSDGDPDVLEAKIDEVTRSIERLLKT